MISPFCLCISLSRFLVIVQPDAQILFNLFIYSSLHVSSMEKQIVSIQLLVIVTPCWWQCAQETVTNTEWQLPEAVLIQFVSPDDEHDMFETCREL